MSILDTEVSTKITREYLAENGWHPDRLERNWWIRKSTRSGGGTAAFCHFVYTFRDPHKRIRNQLKCNSWVHNDKIYSNIKEITDLNVAISCFIGQVSDYFHGK